MFVSAAIFTVLVGCVPATGSYYRVSSPEGSVQGYCSDLGPPVILRLNYGDVWTIIHDVAVFHFPSESSYAFSLDVYLHSKADIVRVAWGQLTATDEITGNQLFLKPQSVLGSNIPYGRGFENFKLDESLYGNKYNDYSFLFLFTKGVSRKMRIHFPDVWVNGVRYPGFDINYVLDSGIFLRC